MGCCLYYKHQLDKLQICLLSEASSQSIKIRKIYTPFTLHD